MIIVLSSVGRMGITIVNVGLFMGFAFGALILLRPVTRRLLRPRHQVWLWFVGWYMGYMFTLFDALGSWLPIPYTFRALVTPRVAEQGFYNYPMYISVGRNEPPSLMLPGGAEFPLSSDLFERLLPVVGVVWVTALTATMVWYTIQGRKLRRLSRQGERMDPETMKRYGITEERVAVRLCEGLPASFVRAGHDTGWGDKVSNVICLQKELPEQQLRLVLLHEIEHIRLHHIWYKTTIVAVLTAFYWWNPVLWLAYRLTCRDMELACDEAVLEELDPVERREYVRTLVELGSGRHLWGSVTSFGECDAALRVRRAVNWKPSGIFVQNASLILAVVLAVFFFCGSPSYDRRIEEKTAEPAWSDFLAGGVWAQAVPDQVGEPKEVWSRMDRQLVVLGEDDKWYTVTFSWWSGAGQYYSRIETAPIEQPSLEGYTRIA